MSISIRIPIYNQPEKLEKCLKSIEEQTLQVDEIILFDDNSSVEYIEILNRFKFLPINYVRNEVNIGAVPNMIKALYYPTKTQYRLVFHEDDVMQFQFIEYSLKAFLKYPQVVFCCSNISFFSNYNDIRKELFDDAKISYLTKKEYIKEILQGKTIGFGTIVYNVNKLKKIEFEFDKYSVLGDRPFLINLIEDNKIVYIDENLSAVYDHSEEDKRWQDISERNIINLFSLYRQELNKNIDKKDKIGFTHEIVKTYNLLSPIKRKLKIIFYIKMIFKGFISLKYLIFLNPNIRRIVGFIKK